MKYDLKKYKDNHIIMKVIFFVKYTQLTINVCYAMAIILNLAF